MKGAFFAWVLVMTIAAASPVAIEEASGSSVVTGRLRVRLHRGVDGGALARELGARDLGSPAYAPRFRIFEVEPSRALFIQRGSWLAASGSVELDTKWGGLKNLAGGEGGFLVRAAGQGTVVASCYGALESWDLKEGERMTLDTGHMVAYQEGGTFQIRKVAGGLVQSLKSGEALVFDFTGPGRVLTQTRSPRMLIDWLTTVLPFSRS
jgi:uncharacterized protein (TIGR00266 family)